MFLSRATQASSGRPQPEMEIRYSDSGTYLWSFCDKSQTDFKQSLLSSSPLQCAFALGENDIYAPSPICHSNRNGPIELVIIHKFIQVPLNNQILSTYLIDHVRHLITTPRKAMARPIDHRPDRASAADIHLPPLHCLFDPIMSTSPSHIVQ